MSRLSAVEMQRGPHFFCGDEEDSVKKCMNEINTAGWLLLKNGLSGNKGDPETVEGCENEVSSR